MRQFWKHYYQGAEAVLFIVDSAASAEELYVATEAIRGALEDQRLAKVPCLILGNCQDKPGARSTDQVKIYMIYS